VNNLKSFSSSNYLIILANVRVNLFRLDSPFLQKLSHAQRVGSFWFYSHALNASLWRKKISSPPILFSSLMTFSSGVQFQLLAPPFSVSFAVSAVFLATCAYTPSSLLILSKANPRKPTKLELAPDPNFEISI